MIRGVYRSYLYSPLMNLAFSNRTRGRCLMAHLSAAPLFAVSIALVRNLFSETHPGPGQLILATRSRWKNLEDVAGSTAVVRPASDGS